MIAFERLLDGDSDVRVAVMDTKRLGPANLVLWAVGIFSIFMMPGAVDDEFLCFGPVSENAHRAVRLEELFKVGVDQFLPCAGDEGDDEVQAAGIAELFGDEFRVVVAAYLLADSPEALARFAQTVGHADVPVACRSNLPRSLPHRLSYSNAVLPALPTRHPSLPRRR
jgi:hypothetical protein